MTRSSMATTALLAPSLAAAVPVLAQTGDARHLGSRQRRTGR